MQRLVTCALFARRADLWRRSAREAADLVVWWDEGYYAEEHEAVEEIVAAFEQETGKKVELVFYPESEHPEAIAAALEAGQPPDFAFGSIVFRLHRTMGLR